ncbi:MAG: 4-alpha-glucanotransferase [Clostridia bacterium]|nr:4-alpha-glucanotransferase [Clostridia bacterium]
METIQYKGKNKCQKREAGILMPVSSLPSNEGIGTLGKGAYRFVDWLCNANMKIWQVLPLLPTGYGDSPYQSYASDALNYYFIDLETLEEEGLLKKNDYQDIVWSENVRRVDYGKLFEYKAEILKIAFSRFDKTAKDWVSFLAEKRYLDFAVFMSLKTKFSYAPWTDWEKEYKIYDETRIQRYVEEHRADVEFWQFTQYLFLKQWNSLLKYAHERKVFIMGDMPIYVSYDSVEAWKYGKDLFMMDENGNLSMLAGVPPDAFCEDGQFWGNPVYDWDKLKTTNYRWWKDRIRYAFTLYDILRIDHFRAFDRFYAIPSGAETAKEGEWLDGPKTDLFQDMQTCAIVAEDLGIIDDGVRALLKATGYPGMKVFEFAFDGNPENEYLPSLYNENCVAYTGTHDNDTLRSFIEQMDIKQRKDFEERLEEECLDADVAYLTETIEDECKSVIELLFASKANLVIIPMQDTLFLGEEARLNAPATVSNRNWTFRFIETDLKNRTAAWLKELTEEYNR